MEWTNQKPIDNIDLVFSFVECFDFKIPDKALEYLILHNGGEPVQSTFDTQTSKNHTLKRLLSFNIKDERNVWEYNNKNKEYLLFALDVKGNPIILYKDGRVFFYDCQTQETQFIAKNFDKFIKSLS